MLPTRGFFNTVHVEPKDKRDQECQVCNIQCKDGKTLFVGFQLKAGEPDVAWICEPCIARHLVKTGNPS